MDGAQSALCFSSNSCSVLKPELEYFFVHAGSPLLDYLARAPISCTRAPTGCKFSHSAPPLRRSLFFSIEVLRLQQTDSLPTLLRVQRAACLPSGRIAGPAARAKSLKLSVMRKLDVCGGAGGD